MFRKKEIVYFVDKDSNILGKLKNPKIIPRKGELILFKPNEQKYYVLEIVYTLEKNSYICWIYLKETI
jgi:hypothetical protein